MMKFLIELLIKIVRFVSESLSFRMRAKAGRMLGSLMYSLLGKRNGIMYDNLSKAFPEKEKGEILKIMHGSYQSLARTYLEALAMRKFSGDYIRRHVKIVNPELIEEIYSRKNGIIFLTGHYGNWELGALATGYLCGRDLSIVVVEQKYGAEMLAESRCVHGNKTLPKDKAAMSLIRAIKQNDIIAMIVDQSADREKDIFVDFFGRPAVTYRAPAELALRFNLSIIFGISLPGDNDDYTIEYIEIEHSDLNHDEGGILELTRRHVKALEDIIRKRPELWAWMHRRWKHQPKN